MKAGFYSADDYSLERSIGYLLRANCHNAAELAERVFADTGLSFAQWLTLFFVDTEKNVTVGRCARLIGHTTGSMTRLIDRLEEKDYVHRRRELADRRQVSLATTARGRAIAKVLLPRLTSMWNDILEEFGEEQSHALIGQLVRLQGIMGRIQKSI